MKEETSVFYNERSYQACVAMGWRVVLGGYRAVLKYAWPQAVLSGAGIALLGFLLFVHYQWLTPTALVVLGFLLLFYGLSAAMWQSAAYVQLDFFRATGDLPARSSCAFLDNLRRRLPRSVVSLLLFVLTAAALGGGAFAAVRLSAWWWLAVAAVVVISVVGGLWVQFMLAEDCAPRRAFELLRHEGLKSLGSWFLVQLTGWVTVCVCTLVLFLPTIVLSASYFVSRVGMWNGDPSGMPAYAAWLYFFVAWLGGTGMHLSTLLAIWPRSLMAASMISKARNREKQEEELQKLRNEQQALRA